MKHATLVTFSILLAVPCTGEDIVDTPSLTLKEYAIFSVDISANAEKILASGIGPNTLIWDSHTGEYTGVFKNLNGVRWNRFSPDGERILCSYYGGYHGPTGNGLWDIETGELLHTFDYTVPPQVNGPLALFTPDGQTIVTACDHRGWWESQQPQGQEPPPQFQLWDAESFKHVRTVPSSVHETSRRWAKSMQFTKDGHRALLVFEYDSGHRLAPTYTGSEVWDTVNWVPIRKDGDKWASSFSPDETQYVCVNRPSEGGWRTPLIRSTETGEAVRRIETGHLFRSIMKAIYSPDGRFILCAHDATARPDLWIATLSLWDAESGEHLRTFIGGRASAPDIAFFPDGRRFISVGYDGVGKIWDISDLVQSDVGKEAEEY